MRVVHCLLIGCFSHTFATTATWNLNAAGNWNVNGNWTPATFPNSIDSVANFGSIITANRTVTLGANITIGTITFDNSHNYTIAGGGVNTLTFQSSTTASLAITDVNGAGAHTINATVASINLSSPLSLTHNSTAGFSIAAPISQGSNDLTVSAMNTGTVTLSGAITGSGSLIGSIASTGNITVSGAISGAEQIIKNGAGGGVMTLSHANSYTGNTTVNSGTLTLSGANTLGGASSMIVMGGTLNLNNTNSYGGTTTISAGTLSYGANGAIPAGNVVTVGDGVSIANLAIATAMTAGNAFPLTINTNGTLNQNASTFLTSLQGTGSVVMTNAGTNNFDISSASSFSFSGPITGGVASGSSNPGTGNRLTKEGTGTLALSSSTSSYVSRTFIASGVIDVQDSNALGAGGANSAVYVQAQTNQGSLFLENNISLSKFLFLNGAGFSSMGALRNLSGTNTVSGNVQIGWTGGTETPATSATILVDGTSLTLSGVISGNTAGVTLTKTGLGTLIYSGGSSNTFNQLTTVSNGTLQLNKTSGLNALAGNATINAGGTLFLSTTNQIINTAVITLGGGTFNMNGNTETIGSLVFNSGTLSQGGAALTLASAAATALTMGDATTISGPLAFTAAGGVLYNGTTTRATISGDIALGNSTHIFDIDDGADSVDMEISGAISGTGAITKSTDPGILLFDGSTANTYSGVTTLNLGEIHLNKTGVNAIEGNVTINGGTLLLQAPEQIIDSSTLTLQGGTFNMAGNAETIGHLVFNSGTLSQGGATLSLSATSGVALTMGDGTTISGNIALTGASGTAGVTYNGTTTTATISGNLDLGSVIRTFNIADGAATTDMLISGVISGTGGISKLTSLGRLDFTGLSANTYTGTTTVSFGTLFLNKTFGNAIVGDIVFNDTSGILQLGASNQIADTSNMTLVSGTFNMSGFSDTIGSLTYRSGTLTQAGGSLGLASVTTALTMRNTTISGAVVLIGGGSVVFDSAVNGTATLSGTLDLGGFMPTFSIANGTAPIDMLVSGVISNGGLSKSGGGTLQFSGASPNTYAGLTSVTAGTLSLNKTIGVNAIAGDISITGGTLVLAAPNQIADTSTLTLAGGTFDMNGFTETIGTFVYNSGTFLQGGALTLTSAGTALSMRHTTITGTILLTGGGSVVFDNTNNGTATLSGTLDLGGFTTPFNIADGTAATDMLVSGVITNGALTKTGLGQLEFSGASPNTYAGLTTVTTGTLLLNKTAGVNAIAGNVLINGGTLTLAAANQIIDTSTVTLSSGTFNLSGFAETIGTFNFNAGTFTQGGALLTLANAGTALSMRDTAISGPLLLTGGGSIVFDSTNNGTATLSGPLDLGGSNITFNIADGTASTDMLISGVISDGALTKTGAGTLVLTGANIYGSGTLVSAGTLQGDTTSLQGNITDNATLIFDQASTGTYSSSLSGTGALIKQGAGSLTLSNTNSVAGAVSLTAGTLAVDGTLAGGGLMTTSALTRLQGVGTITKDTSIGGTLAPGDSIGTIHFVGNQTLTSGSILEIELSPTTTDLVDIIGTLTIEPGAALSLFPELGTYTPPLSYTIVHTTGGVTGTFGSVTSTLPLFIGSVTYSPLNVMLILKAGFLPFSDLVTKGNAGAVARCLDALMPNPCENLSAVINTLRMLPTTKALEKALIQMQPSAFTSLAVAQENDVLYIRNALYNRLDDQLHSCSKEISSDKNLTFWMTALGAHTSQQNRHDEPGFIANSPGAFVGLDSRFGKRSSFGGGVGYTHTHLHWRENRGEANTQTAYGALYGRWAAPRLYLQSSLTGGYNFYSIHRHIKFGTFEPIDDTAHSTHQGVEGSAHLKLGLPLRFHQTTLSPFIGSDYIFLHETSFHENGAQSLNLKVKSKNSDLLSSEAGFDLSHCYTSKKNHIYTPFLKLSAIRESRFHGRKEKASMECGCNLVVTGLYPSRTLGAIAVGLNAAFSESSFSLLYQGKFSRSYSDNSVYLQYLLRY